MQNPNSEHVGKFQQLISKNPLAFVASVFFIMFWITYFININKNSDSEQYWKELYEKERGEKDRLKDELLFKAGIIERQQHIIKEADSTLRNNTMPEAKELLKTIK